MISLVIRVISVEVPALSILVKFNPWICSNTACRSLVEKPTAAFAAKNCAVTALTSPTTARASRHSPILTIWPVSGLPETPMPLSMMLAMTRGTNNSKKASSSLNSGASTDSFL